MRSGRGLDPPKDFKRSLRPLAAMGVLLLTGTEGTGEHDGEKEGKGEGGMKKREGGEGRVASHTILDSASTYVFTRGHASEYGKPN